MRSKRSAFGAAATLASVFFRSVVRSVAAGAVLLARWRKTPTVAAVVVSEVTESETVTQSRHVATHGTQQTQEETFPRQASEGEALPSQRAAALGFHVGCQSHGKYLL